ncbi:MAG TPA: hypothetical protein VM325_13235 [Alphaproteobacteria bacterium]|nr:hypothetical protein [Alphaproteobacteria bacterium]
MRHQVKTLAIVVASLIVASAAYAVGRDDGKACKSSEANPYHGTFKWRGANSPQRIRFWFDRTEPAGEGKLNMFGGGIYLAPPPTRIAIRAKVNLKSGRIEIWESHPSQPIFLTSGSHVGTISADRCSIRAVWTTGNTGQKGDLTLDIKRK